MELRISGVEKESIVDGPGFRYVIFTQGCLHKCKGCQNPNTHDLDGGYKINLEYLIEDVLKNKFLDGVTFSGGEPFLQSKQCAYLAKALKAHNLNIMCYTGFTYEQLISSPQDEYNNFMKYIDVLVDGPFINDKIDRSLQFRGSTNQRIINVSKSMRENKLIFQHFYKFVC